MNGFQPALPVWGATRRTPSTTAPHENFNPRSPCGERQQIEAVIAVVQAISIRAPRVGSDRYPTITDTIGTNFNPRSPCGERPAPYVRAFTSNKFQSALPVWGATATLSVDNTGIQFQSALPVWGATTPFPVPWRTLGDFNPRSPCGERPARASACRCGPWNFNPRSPCGERRALLDAAVQFQRISIRAPRVGSDRRMPGLPTPPNYFNPRSPCGERPPVANVWASTLRFQSALPVWGATPSQLGITAAAGISIRAPRVGSDARRWRTCGHPRSDFNPRSPCGERRLQSRLKIAAVDISIRAPRVGSDR